MMPEDLKSFLPLTLMAGVYWLAAFVVLAESLNKLQRTDVLRRGMTRWTRLRELLNVLGWGLFATGAAGALVAPLLYIRTVHLQEVLVMVGLALFILHRRLKEVEVASGAPVAPVAPEVSDFMPILEENHRARLWAAIRHKGRRAHDAD